MWYSPAANDHACQDPECEYAQGMRASLYAYRFKMPRHSITDVEVAALSRLGLNDFYAQEARMDFVAKLNSATKYPSIETYHRLEKGILQEEATLFEDLTIGTEKVNGTNGRIVFMPDGKDYCIGSREHLLYAKGDRVIRTTEGIVAALKRAGDKR